MCKVRGIYRQGRTIVPSAVRALPRQHTLRAKYAQEFSEDPTLKAYGTLGRATKRTKEEAKASADQAQTLTKSKKKDVPFVSPSPFASLPYHDVTKHCFIDPAHTEANMVKLLSNQVTNSTGKKGKIAFGKKQREFEVGQLQRFPYLTAAYTKKKYSIIVNITTLL